MAYTTIFAANGAAKVGGANQYLQAVQAGWVYTAAKRPTKLSFTQASKNRSVSETTVFKTTAKKASTGQLRLALYESAALAANQSAADGVLVLVDDNGNNAVDVPKFANLDENFATNNNGSLLSIQTRATPVQYGRNTIGNQP